MISPDRPSPLARTPTETQNTVTPFDHVSDADLEALSVTHQSQTVPHVVSTVPLTDPELNPHLDDQSHGTPSAPIKEMLIPEKPASRLTLASWIHQHFAGTKGMFLSLPYLHIVEWLNHLKVQTLEEFSALSIQPLATHITHLGKAFLIEKHSIFLELLVISSFYSTQVNTVPLPWNLEQYFSFRMTHYHTLQGIYSLPNILETFSPAQTSPATYVPPHHRPRASSPPSSKRGDILAPIPSEESSEDTDPELHAKYMEAQAEWETQYSPTDFAHLPPPSNHSKHSSLRDLSISSRKKKQEQFQRYHAQPRMRSNIASEKLQWSGSLDTFMAFSADLEGTLTRIGASYMFSAQILKNFHSQGYDMADSDTFWEAYGVSKRQFQYDSNFLYGVLLSATKDRKNPHILKYRETKNGLAVWIEFTKAYSYGGSIKVRTQQLEHLLHEYYNLRSSMGFQHTLMIFKRG